MYEGEIKTLKVEDLAHGGDGVARTEAGIAVFIPLTIPGDLIRAKITKLKKNYAFATLLEIIEAGEGRKEPPCPVYEDCGGCQLQHLEYKKELELKNNNIEQLLKRIAGIEQYKRNKVLAADDQFRYRNKAQFPLSIDEKGKIKAGFYKRGSHQLVPYHDCLIQHPLINRILKASLAELNKREISIYNEEKGKGLLRHLVIRVGICTNQALLIFVTNKEEFAAKREIAAKVMAAVPELKGVIQNINSKNTNVIFGDKDITISGYSYIKEYINQTAYLISARSFFQVNTLQAEKLYNKVLDYLGDNEEQNIVDAFSGTGSIALYIADKAAKVFAIESLKSAVEDGEKNAELNEIKNIKFVNGLVEDKLAKILNEEKIDSIIFDPPRKGLADETITLLNELEIEKIIYISCNPATQARDLKKLKEKYELLEIQGVDMFPQTYHIESAALLELK
ncbi:23S rRNA (uracil(1939)-C(5))-methyltransferase RlmD [Halanaerobium sp. Z-7514]|uniref:23S rRNA (Uracil(1939)-C(5))-methyltransferase RlmD n=1 Tax=Halanaerobium polyolivorans TaxID=2886943 RepID=A0AAW4X2A7_9FIRM|nr:23S rRNA (uracil(1939)-C(5))-methyltransferase RlmD [Halanaerobium polyolivorans]MCC3145902.1 23S rRNA (uracil(1939)-C(5))-methyltransferase RlmD [Halanaerobium polyolivorans]